MNLVEHQYFFNAYAMTTRSMDRDRSSSVPHWLQILLSTPAPDPTLATLTLSV